MVMAWLGLRCVCVNARGSGKRSLETICLLLAYKIKYPGNFFLLRGNHEAAQINRCRTFHLLTYLLTHSRSCASGGLCMP